MFKSNHRRAVSVTNKLKVFQVEIHAHAELIRKTQACLAKKKQKREELEDKLKTIKNELDQQWNEMKKND